jgi:hypothetical protein
LELEMRNSKLETSPGLDLEAEASQDWQELALNGRQKPVDAERLALVVATMSVPVGSLQHSHATEQAIDCGLDCRSRHEREAELIDRSPHVPFGVASRKARGAQAYGLKGRLDGGEISIDHRKVPGATSDELPGGPLPGARRSTLRRTGCSAST